MAANMLINSAMTNSTRLTALTALSLTLAAISEFARPRLYSKNCSTAIGKKSLARSAFEKNLCSFVKFFKFHPLCKAWVNYKF